MQAVAVLPRVNDDASLTCDLYVARLLGFLTVCHAADFNTSGRANVAQGTTLTFPINWLFFTLSIRFLFAIIRRGPPGPRLEGRHYGTDFILDNGSGRGDLRLARDPICRLVCLQAENGFHEGWPRRGGYAPRGADLSKGSGNRSSQRRA